MNHLYTAFFVGFLFVSSTYAQINPANNLIAISMNLPEDSAHFPFDSCFTLCYNLGMRSADFPFSWNMFEPAPSKYDLTLADELNAFSTIFPIAMNISLSPIATNNRTMPADLSALPFNSPILIHRYEIVLDSVFEHIKNVNLFTFRIGIEFDVYLGTDTVMWQQYIEFFDSVAAYARLRRPGIRIACEATYDGMTTYARDHVLAINQNCDVIGVSYYNLNSDFTVKLPVYIHTAFNTVVNLFPAKPIYFVELGYPSSVICKSSYSMQAQFIDEIFSAWDSAASHVVAINFLQLHDFSPQLVQYYSSFYRIQDTIFKEYLGSYGLRTYPGIGSNKPAFDRLVCDAAKRGYSNIICNEAVNQEALNTHIVIRPNPFTNVLYIEIPREYDGSELILTNSLGKIVYRSTVQNECVLDLSEGSLPAGLYLYEIRSPLSHQVLTDGKLIKK